MKIDYLKSDDPDIDEDTVEVEEVKYTWGIDDFDDKVINV